MSDAVPRSTQWQRDQRDAGRCTTCAVLRGEDGTTTLCRACADKQAAYARGRTLRPAGRWQQIVSRARNRARDHRSAWDERYMNEWFVERVPLVCDYSSAPFDFDFTKGRGERSFCSPSIDQLRPGVGYVRGNAFAVLWGLNAGKSNFGLEELEESNRHWNAALPRMRELMSSPAVA